MNPVVTMRGIADTDLCSSCHALYCSGDMASICCSKFAEKGSSVRLPCSLAQSASFFSHLFFLRM